MPRSRYIQALATEETRDIVAAAATEAGKTEAVLAGELIVKGMKRLTVDPALVEAAREKRLSRRRRPAAE